MLRYKCMVRVIYMNRKGFTLVELLAVIVILSSISLIVVGSISSSLIKRDEKECFEQMELAKNAAKIYFSLDKNGDTSVTVKELMDAGYFSENKKIDRLDENWIITYDDSGYKFENESNLKCKDL